MNRKTFYSDTVITRLNYNLVTNDELTSWQKKVHSDPNEFYNMCKTLGCYPNLWALHEWANWLTPTFFPASSRFDAAFFFTCLSKIPISQHDNGEINEIVVSISYV